MSDIMFKIEHLNEGKSIKNKSVSVKAKLSEGQKEEQKCPLLSKGNGARTQKDA
jgi:hypothetical protein